MTPPRKPTPDSSPPGIIEADAVYVAAEFYRRMRWHRHSQRQARRLGLPVIRFGSRDYIIGRKALEWLEKLAEGAVDT